MKAGLCTCVLGVLSLTALVSSNAVPRRSYADKTRANSILVRRSEMSNAINTMPSRVHDTSASGDSNVGDELMEEFLTFLTLKETGLLDMCLMMKR